MDNRFEDTGLDARLEGKHFVATSGESTHYYYFSHENMDSLILFVGSSLYAWDSNAGDSVTFHSEYYVKPLDTWKRYKKFAKNWQVFPNLEMKDILFPTKPKTGIRIAIKYFNTGFSDVKFSINFYNFVDISVVNPSLLQEGVDW